MKTGKPFFDTNIALYLLSEDQTKADCVEILLSGSGIISVQVLNEFTSVAHRKLKMSYAEIRETLQIIQAVCQVKPLTLLTHETGLMIAEKYRYSFYDSLIISAALHAECQILYSEDMQHGQMIENRLLIQNPFLG